MASERQLIIAAKEHGMKVFKINGEYLLVSEIANLKSLELEEDQPVLKDQRDIEGILDQRGYLKVGRL